MKFSTAVIPLTLLALFHLGSGALFRGTAGGGTRRTVVAPLSSSGADEPTADNIVGMEAASFPQSRLLSVEYFSPLDCNYGISNVSCIPWSTRFGDAPIQMDRVVVDCGECIVMDFAGGPVLTLLGGIDIRGKLVFPDGYELTVNSTMVAVQGELILRSTKPIDGIPAIKFFMTGETDQFFEPIGNNAMKCDGRRLCLAGKKAIAVAAGRIEVDGLPDPDMPTWVKLYDVESADTPNVLVVDRAVMGKWAPGAEVVITSYTTAWDGHQVRKIQNVSEHSNPAYVRIQLNSSIARPTTMQDSPSYAVEVALLSRNIVFEGGPDLTPRHGGHFSVFNTPGVLQLVSGLEVRNFGQQGTLGRYPIHFHLNGDLNGSVISKNTVRESNQRAIVVHGTNRLLVEQNVVFNTKGHAFILEDGIETDNIFYRNLGAATGRVNVIIPNEGFNGKETDDSPATFWITNPMNTFIENVAAGSEHSGFWFELRKRGIMADQFSFDPRNSPLGTFLGNVAHSNFDRGLRTYPIGYVPDETANLVGVLSYKNRKGLFFHDSQNIAVINSTFADNGIAVHIDGADYISVRDTKIIGKSAPDFCSNQGEVVGLQMNTFLRRADSNGGRFRNITFAGFQSGNCSQQMAHLKLDNKTRFQTGPSTFDWITSFEEVKVLDETVIFNFCSAEAVGVTSVYLVDVDGSLDEKRDGLGNPGTIVSNSDVMMKFLDAGKCTVIGSQCRAYCDACFRTVRFATDPEGTDSYLLQICSSTGSPCIQIPGYIDLDPDMAKNADNLRIYVAHLPKGSYTASFVNSAQGEQVWPTFVNDTYRDALCSGSLQDGAIQVMAPDVRQYGCSSLIRNGNSSSLDGWLQRGGGLKLVPNSGMDGSSALSDTRQSSARDVISQFLDTRCFDLMKGQSYEISAWVKLIDKSNTTRNCLLDNRGCPEVRIFLTPGTTRPRVATVVPQLNKNGLHLLHGVLTVDQELADSKIVELAVRRNRADFSMRVDGVSAILMPSLNTSNPICDNDLVWNGNFDSGNAKFWSPSSAILKIVCQVGGYQLSISKGYAQTFLKAGCFEAGERYEVSVEYKMLRRGQLMACNSTVPPSAKLFPNKANLQLAVQSNIVQPVETGPDRGWCFLYGIFTASSDTGNADQLTMRLENLSNIYEYILDHVKITHNPQKCGDNILANGDMLMGVQSFWIPVGSGSVAWTTPGFDGFSDGAMLSYGRQSASHGPRYNTANFLDTRCLVPGSTWEIQAQMKLVDSVTGRPTDCRVFDPTSSSGACPGIRLMITDAKGTKVLDSQVRGYATNSWDISGWNKLLVQVALPSSAVWDGSASTVFLQVRNFPVTKNVLIDNFVVRQVR